MKRLHFEKVIDAPRETVWDTMLNPETFKQWTAEFAEGSYYEGSWEKGEEIRFFAPDGSGVSSVIADNRPNEFVSIKHVGLIKDGIEDKHSPDVLSWAPVYENYTLSDVGNSTRVEVDMDAAPDYEQTMSESWPRALDRLKAISEDTNA